MDILNIIAMINKEIAHMFRKFDPIQRMIIARDTGLLNDYFNIEKVIKYDDKKILELQNNQEIVRNKLKINATINNTNIFKKIQKEYKTFDNYIWSFTNYKTIYETNKTSSELSDKISKDLKSKGMKFIGTIIIYSYLQSIGIINSHEQQCFRYKKVVGKYYFPTTFLYIRNSISSKFITSIIIFNIRMTFNFIKINKMYIS